MKKTLFYTFIAIFIATAIITLWGLLNKDLIDPVYLEKLFYLLIAEIIAPVIALFKNTKFFNEDPEDIYNRTSKINVLMLPKSEFPRKFDPHNCTVTVFNQDTDEERHVSLVPKRENGYLSMYLDTLSEQEMIKVHIKNTTNESWESDYFSPSVDKEELEKR